VVQTLDAPEGVTAAFSPRNAVLSSDGSTLFTLGTSADGQAAAVVTDAVGGRVARAIDLPGGPDEYAGQLPVGGKLLAYQLTEATIHEVDPSSGAVRGSAQLDPEGGATPAGNETGTLTTAVQGSVAYAVVPSGGIAKLQPDPIQATDRLAPDHHFRSVAASSDGSLLYTVESDGAYTVLQAPTGQQVLRRPNANATGLLQASAGE